MPSVNHIQNAFIRDLKNRVAAKCQTRYRPNIGILTPSNNLIGLLVTPVGHTDLGVGASAFRAMEDLAAGDKLVNSAALNDTQWHRRQI